jgi:hypothetical protein
MKYVTNSQHKYTTHNGQYGVSTYMPYIAESLSLFSRMYGSPTDTYKLLINSTIVSLKNAGIWDKMDCCYFFAADSSYNAKLNWKQDAFNCTTFSNIDFSTNAGFFRSAPGSQGTVQMEWSLAINASNFTQTSNSAGTYYNLPQAISQYSIIGSTYYLYLRPSYQTKAAAYDGGTSTAIVITDSNTTCGSGLSVVERINSNIMRILNNGFTINTSLNTQVNSFSSTPYMLVSDVSNKCLQFGYYGANLTDSQHIQLKNIVGSFIYSMNSSTPYYSDNFENYPVGSLLGQDSWVLGFNSFNVVTGKYVTPNTNLSVCIARNQNYVADNQFSQITVATVGGANDAIGAAVRLSGHGSTACGYGYYCMNGTQRLWRIDNGVKTNLGTYGTATLNVGDVLRLEASGNTLTAYRNGVIDTGVGNSGTYTDTTYPSGDIGICGYSNGTTYGDNWVGGNL